MKIRYLISLLLIIILLSISFFYQKNDKINYTVIGNKREFTSNLKSLNYIDLIKNDLVKQNKLNNYSKDFIYSELFINDLIDLINNNKKENNKTIQNVLSNTDLLIINLGHSELDYKLSNYNKYNYSKEEIYNNLDRYILDIKKLNNIIIKYTKAKIIFIGFYNSTDKKENDNYYKYINNKIKFNSKIYFIDVFETLKQKNSNYFLDYEDNMYIYRKIINKISCKN